MGHIVHLRKQFNQHLIIIMLIERRKKPLFTLLDLNGSAFEQTWIPFTQGYFAPNLVEIGPAVLKMKFLNFRQCIFAFSLLPPPLSVENCGPYLWTNLNLFTQGCIVPSLVEIGPVILEKIFLSPLPKDALDKFGRNWLNGSGEEDENVKSLQQRQQQRRLTTDKFWSEKLTWPFRSGKLKKIQSWYLSHLNRRLLIVFSFDFTKSVTCDKISGRFRVL